MSTPNVTTLGRLPAESSEAPSSLSAQTFDSLAAAEPVWRELETRGRLTPYQRFDWIRAYMESGFGAKGDIAILTLSAASRPIALVPFLIQRRFGLRIAQIIGMPISNGDAVIFDPDFIHLLTRDALRSAFKTLPADLVNFHCVAPHAGPTANPLLAFPHTPSPDHFYANELVPGDTPYIEQSLPHKRRTNIKRSRRRLAEALGEVRLEHAQSADDIDAMLEIFLEQRSARFKTMGIENVFARPHFRTFFRRLCVEGLGQDRPAMRVHALYAGDTVVATSLGTYGANHYSQYINSTDSGEASRYSLMGVTLSLLVDELRETGVTGLDMGLGDFDYKLDWTRKTVVHDIVIANSALGRAATPLLRNARSLKRTIKQTPQLWRAARALQSFKTALSGRKKG
ncbi:GNAT family N-acetyltransferase [Pelagibacterium luteolum]|uniref:Acetyltransferase involved in cellulose biosynthesis, CelD/BcsL family n=1 Tax=Pelagibacterium luteolum TaxID=440168 RepID=A0A1G7Y366_9HYPH|nr:GNAT family N-acetyltransferase [Pelagibacterium luteolum]SDG90803.1 Acetyltransferase involved in cellulose biosynthesis, CelD/BcsL family [Pelagibacterium luteolum]